MLAKGSGSFSIFASRAIEPIFLFWYERDGNKETVLWSYGGWRGNAETEIVGFIGNFAIHRVLDIEAGLNNTERIQSPPFVVRGSGSHLSVPHGVLAPPF